MSTNPEDAMGGVEEIVEQVKERIGNIEIDNILVLFHPFEDNNYHKDKAGSDEQLLTNFQGGTKALLGEELAGKITSEMMEKIKEASALRAAELTMQSMTAEQLEAVKNATDRAELESVLRQGALAVEGEDQNARNNVLKFLANDASDADILAKVQAVAGAMTKVVPAETEIATPAESDKKAAKEKEQFLIDEFLNELKAKYSGFEDSNSAPEAGAEKVEDEKDSKEKGKDDKADKEQQKEAKQEQLAKPTDGTVNYRFKIPEDESNRITGNIDPKTGSGTLNADRWDQKTVDAMFKHMTEDLKWRRVDLATSGEHAIPNTPPDHYRDQLVSKLQAAGVTVTVGGKAPAVKKPQQEVAAGLETGAVTPQPTTTAEEPLAQLPPERQQAVRDANEEYKAKFKDELRKGGDPISEAQVEAAHKAALKYATDSFQKQLPGQSVETAADVKFIGTEETKQAVLNTSEFKDRLERAVEPEEGATPTPVPK